MMTTINGRNTAAERCHKERNGRRVAEARVSECVVNGPQLNRPGLGATRVQIPYGAGGLSGVVSR